jgi:hypothetical protein
MIWRGVDGNSPILQQLIGNVFSPSAWSRREGPSRRISRHCGNPAPTLAN